MLRRLIIACGTLGLILIGFGLYRSRNPVPEAVLPPLPEVSMAPSATAPTTQQSVPGIQGLQIAPGREASFEVFDRTRGELQYLMRATEWKAESENELSLKKPELWKFMRNGQILRVIADNGQITVEPAGKSNFKPKRGWLHDNVRISIDLTTRQWRQAHPEREALEQHPEHVIHITMDSLYFDDDLSLVRTDGAVEVHAARFDVTSTGMKMIYSRPMDRLEHLSLLKAGTLSLRGQLDAGATGPTLPAPARVRARASSPASNDASGPATRAASTSSAPAERASPARYHDIYKALFEGPILVEQFRDDQLVARLDSDKLLELVFDMNQQERPGDDAEGREKGLPAVGPSDADEADNSRTVLTWAGSLEVAPLERAPQDSAGRTTRIRAAGDSVVLEDKEDGNTITCHELDYDVIRRSGRIAARSPGLARLVDSRGGSMAGREIRFDEGGHTLVVNGPGEASEPRSTSGGMDPALHADEGSTKIQWASRMLVRFRRTQMPMALSVIPLRMPDKPAAMARLNRQSIFEMQRPLRRMSPLAGNPLKGLMAESATIVGEALVQRGEQTLHAEKLSIGFFEAARGKTFGPIRSAFGEGQVRLVSRDQNITADSLDVYFAPAGPDRSTPSRAIAQGHARATQGPSQIEADFLDAILGQVPAGLRQEDAAGSTSPRMKPAVVAMTASGSVRIRDPEQGLDLSGTALTAAIPDGRQVKEVTIKGTTAAPARVAMKDYTLAGPSIQADLETQDVMLPSAGSLKLLVRQGPEGSRLDSPRPLELTWTDRMQMWGARNQANFEGHVQAILASTEQAGDDTAVTADRMTVFFRTIGQTEEPQAPAEASPAREAMEKLRQEMAHVMPVAAEWLPGPRSRADRPAADLGVQREPVKVIAEGDARAVSSRYESARGLLASRLLIEGPTFIADLSRDHLEVPGKGRLLLENYAVARFAAKLASVRDPATLPAIKGASEDDLSQTVFAWTNGMTFSLNEQLAIFDGDVNMIYRAGSKVVLGAQLSEALGARPALLQVMPGRLASLNADNLVVQFSEPRDRAASRQEPAADQWMRRAELENMIATGNVYLNEDLTGGGSNFLSAGRVQYSGQRDTFVIQGAPGSPGGRGTPARLVRQKDARSAPETDTGDAFWWNRGTGEVSIRGIRGQRAQ